MTPTEVLQEIRKLPPTEKREILRELSKDLAEPELAGYGEKEKKFIASMKQKGLISQVPNRFNQKISPKRFERVNVIGKPMSETIIEDRG